MNPIICAKETKPSKNKATIPKALREQVWIHYVGTKYQSKCPISWCKNTISVFDFEVGHNIPESKGGGLEIVNLRPICARCNRSMSDNYTIDAWDKLGGGATNSVCCGCWP